MAHRYTVLPSYSSFGIAFGVNAWGLRGLGGKFAVPSENELKLDEGCFLGDMSYLGEEFPWEVEPANEFNLCFMLSYILAMVVLWTSLRREVDPPGLCFSG